MNNARNKMLPKQQLPPQPPVMRSTPNRPGLTEEQRAEIVEAFELFDTEKTGEISLHELKVCLKSFGFKVCKAELLKLRASCEAKGGSAAIPFAAYERIMEQKFHERDPREELMRAFRLFDENNKGGITVDDLRRVARELGEAVREEELRAMIEEFDDDQDGKINEAEFMNILTDFAHQQ